MTLPRDYRPGQLRVKSDRLLRFALCAAVLHLSTPSRAQVPSPTEPPVMRAIPMGELPVLRAIAVEPAPLPKPTATPQPLPPAPPPPAPTAAATPPVLAVPPPAATPLQAYPPYPPQPGQGQGYRIAPAQAVTPPDQLQFAAANAAYQRQSYEEAAAGFERFLLDHPGAPNTDAALYRLAECYRLQNDMARARGALQRLLAIYRDGLFYGPASYRLGEIYLGEQNWRAALPMFEIAGKRIQDPEVRLAALVREARCLEMLDRPESARAAYRRVMEVKENNPYLDLARLSLARLAEETGRRTEALSLYENIAKDAAKPERRAEAACRAGILATELKDLDRAATLFRITLETPEANNWGSVARLGLVRLSHARGDFEGVLRAFETGGEHFGGEAEAELLYLAGDSYRLLDRHQEARAQYDAIRQKFPASPFATKAQVGRLRSLYNLKDPATLAAADEFLTGTPQGPEAAEARLIKAELLYQQKDFAGAAEHYAALAESELSEDNLAEVLYRLAYCQLQAGATEPALATFTRFLEKYPGHKQAATAYAYRAQARQQKNDLAGALLDYEEIITRHRQSKERELAMQKKALILGQHKDNAAMVEAFRQLLREYPKTDAAGQAHYWIGNVAFEKKKYEESLAPLDAARKADPEAFGERAALRVMLANYYLERRDDLRRELDTYLGANPQTPVPSEVLRWIGMRFYNDGDPASAARYLGLLAGRENPVPPPADTWLVLGQSETANKHWEEAKQALGVYLKAAAGDPPAQARGLLALAETQRGAGEAAAARGSIDQVLKLQPEGRLNAEARLLGAELEMDAARHQEAAKAFLSVALLHEDATLTPRALERAAAAYRQAGDTAEADKIHNELRSRFPEFKLRER